MRTLNACAPKETDEEDCQLAGWLDSDGHGRFLLAAAAVWALVRKTKELVYGTGPLAGCVHVYTVHGIMDRYQVFRGGRREMTAQDTAMPLTITCAIHGDGMAATSLLFPHAPLFLGLLMEHM